MPIESDKSIIAKVSLNYLFFLLGNRLAKCEPLCAESQATQRVRVCCARRIINQKDSRIFSAVKKAMSFGVIKHIRIDESTIAGPASPLRGHTQHIDIFL